MNPRLPIVLCAAAALAQGEVHRLTLKQAIDIALKQNPDLLLARFDEMKAQQAIREARDPFFPKVVVGSGLAYTSGFPLSIEGSAPSVVRADAIQSLFNRQRSYEVAKVREQARSVSLDVQGKREEVALTVASAWLDVERTSGVLRLAEDQAASYARLEEVTAARVAEQRELELEAKKAVARSAQARHRVRTLRLDEEHQHASLAILLGYPVTDRVQPVRGEESLALTTPSDAAAAEAAAVENSKVLKAIESRMQAAGLDIKANQAARLPKIDLVAQYGLFARFNNYDDFFQRFQRHNGQLGVSFQIPLLAGSAASARAAQAEAQSARLRIEMDHTRNRIRLDARQAFDDLEAAQSFREVARLDLEAAREQVAVTLAQWNEGRVPLRQLEESRVLESDRWNLFLEAQTRVERLRLVLLKQTGQLLAALQ